MDRGDRYEGDNAPYWARYRGKKAESWRGDSQEKSNSDTGLRGLVGVAVDDAKQTVRVVLWSERERRREARFGGKKGEAEPSWNV
jgi:hypothetical protein